MAKNYKSAVTTEVAIDGEKEYKKSCDEIVKNLKELGSEMKRVSAEFADNSDSLEAMQSKYEILGKELKEQERLIAATTKALKELEDAGQGNSDQAQKLRTELNKTNTYYIQIQRSMEKMSAAMDKAGAEYEQYRKSAEGIDDTLEELGDELKLLEKQMKVSEDSVSDLARKQELLTQVLDKQEQKAKDLERAYQASVRETGEMSKETKDLRRALNQAKGDIADTQNELKQLGNALENAGNDANEAEKEFFDLGDALSNLGGPFGEAGDMLSSLQDKMGAFGVSIPNLINPTSIAIAGVGAALGSVVINSVQFADEVQQAMVSIQKQTGMAADKMDKFKGVMKDLYSAGIGESVGDIADAMSKVTQVLGEVDTQTLRDVTAGLLGLQDAFDMDFQESIRAAEKLMNTFDADARTTFDVIARAAQLGLNQNDNLLDTINEYAVHYQQLGLSMDDMFASLRSAKEAGIFDLDKAGDAIKEFGVRVREGAEEAQSAFKTLGLNADEMIDKFNEGGPAAKEAFKQVTDALFAMDDQVEQNKIGLALFGTMWEDIGKETVAATVKMESGLGEVEGAIDEINTADLSTIEGALNRLGDVGAETGGIAFGWLETWLPDVINNAADMLDRFNKRLNWREEFGKEYGSELVDREDLPDIDWDELNEKLAALKLGIMQPGEVAGPPAPAERENYYIEDLWASGALDEQKISAHMAAIQEGIVAAAKATETEVVTIYGGMGKKSMESYGVAIDEGGEEVEGSVADVMQGVVDLAAELMSTSMPQVGTDGMNALAGGITEAAPTVSDAATGAVDTAAANSTESAKTGGTQVGSTMVIAMGTGIDNDKIKFMDAVSRAGSEGKAVLESYVPAFNSGGSDLANATADGFGEAAGNIQRAVDSAVQGAVAGITAGVGQIAAKVREAQALAAEMPSGSGSGSGGTTINQSVTVSGGQTSKSVAKGIATALKGLVREVT